MGSGYTVEGQKTSEESFGGLQIEIIPEMQVSFRSFYKDDDFHIGQYSTGRIYFDKTMEIGEHNTPLEVGCSPGDCVRSYPRNPISSVPFSVRDLVGETDGEATCTVSRRPQVSTLGMTQ